MNLLPILLPNRRWRNRVYRMVTRFYIRPRVDRLRRPLVAVTGSAGKTTVTRLINRILLEAGHRTGCACTDGVLVSGHLIHRGDHSGGNGLWRVLRHRPLDAVVAETARGAILRFGLGFSSCAVSVVTNVHEDHLGLDGVHTVEEMARVKAILPRVTRPDGAAVLNGDEPLVREMARQTAARVIYFSLNENPESLADCLFLRDGTIFRKHGREARRLLAADEIFITLGGAATFQIANAMAALAAIEALQPRLPVPRASLERTLADFGRRAEDLPGRLQLYRFRGMDVLLSMSKNPETYRQEVPLLRRLAQAHGYRRLVCVVSDVGDRQEIHYRKISRAVGELGDVVICLPPRKKYLRGRTGEEIVRLLASEIPPEKLAQPRDVSLAGLSAQFGMPGSEPTLFISFSTVESTLLDVGTLRSQGEWLPLRVAAPPVEPAPPTSPSTCTA